MSRRQIARHRGTSLDAVKYHLENIAGKLGVSGGVRTLRTWPGYPAAHRAPRRQERTMQGTRTPGTSSLRLGPVGQVSLSIRDVPRAERFYGETLGLPHVFTFGDLAFFDADGLRIYLHRKDDADWQPGSVLYFRVPDIRSAHEELAARGVRFTGAPHLIYTDDATGDEEWMAFFEDGEGNTLALMSRVPAASA
jgi:predicted enzyme related to lactoylglutathione lyase